MGDKVMKRHLIIALTLIFTLSNFAMAARVSGKSNAKKIKFTRAKKSKVKLTAVDLALIDKAIEGNFSNLTNDEKDKLAEFLSDFGANAAHEKTSGGSNK